MSTEINARESGIHSLAEAYRAFKVFHEDHSRKFALKDAIMRTHHGLEALFKHLLYQFNPVLVLKDEIKVKEIMQAFTAVSKKETETIVDNEETIGLEKTIQRLHDLGVIKTADDVEYFTFYDAVKKLAQYRHRLQHFKVNIDPDSVSRLLGSVLPRGTIIVNETYAEATRQFLQNHRQFPFYGVDPIFDDLGKIYNEWKSIYDILVSEYDQLIQEAVKKFMTQTFKGQTLKLKIIDRGKWGDDPVFMDLESKGFLDFTFRSIDYRIRSDAVTYPASVTVAQPHFVETDKYSHQGVAEGSLSVELSLYLSADKNLKVQGTEKEVAFLRIMRMDMKTEMTYKAVATLSEWHFSTGKIIEATGRIQVTVEILPMGSEGNREKIIGRYECSIDEKNAPFSCHAFVDVDGTLKGNHSLDWKIETISDLVFQ